MKKLLILGSALSFTLILGCSDEEKTAAVTPAAPESAPVAPAAPAATDEEVIAEVEVDPEFLSKEFLDTHDLIAIPSEGNKLSIVALPKVEADEIVDDPDYAKKNFYKINEEKERENCLAPGSVMVVRPTRTIYSKRSWSYDEATRDCWNNVAQPLGFAWGELRDEGRYYRCYGVTGR